MNRKYIFWTPAMDAMLGTVPDIQIGRLFGFSEAPAQKRRAELGIGTYRASQKPSPIPCANCAVMIYRRRKDHIRSKRLFCSTTCAASGQKRRDSETLRYGPGWKNRRAEIRARDKKCRACGRTPEQNGAALQVHHLKPFRFGGTNQPKNLVALCESCHHRLEAVTEQVLSAIQVEVVLTGHDLEIQVNGETKWPL